MDQFDQAALRSAIDEYFGAFARRTPEGYAAAFAGACGSATLDDVSAAIKANLDDGPQTPASAPALARAARLRASARAGPPGARRPCACWRPPHLGSAGDWGVRTWAFDGHRLIPHVAACALCQPEGRGLSGVRRVDPRLLAAERVYMLRGHDAAPEWSERLDAAVAALREEAA